MQFYTNFSVLNGRSIHFQMLYKIGALEYFAKFTGKHLYGRSLFLIKQRDSSVFL